MLEFLDLICARLGDIFYNAVRTALTAARVLYGLCYLIAAICLFGLAVLLEQQMGDKVPAMDVGAFLIAWWALSLAIEGLEQLARSEPQKTVPAGPFLLENRAVEDGTVSMLPTRRRTDS